MLPTILLTWLNWRMGCLQGVNPKIGVVGPHPPKWMVKIVENPIKMDDLGGKPPIFWKYPYTRKPLVFIIDSFFWLLVFLLQCSFWKYICRKKQHVSKWLVVINQHHQLLPVIVTSPSGTDSPRSCGAAINTSEVSQSCWCWWMVGIEKNKTEIGRKEG